jgi:hypothetical protein
MAKVSGRKVRDGRLASPEPSVFSYAWRGTASLLGDLHDAIVFYSTSQPDRKFL